MKKIAKLGALCPSLAAAMAAIVAAAPQPAQAEGGWWWWGDKTQDESSDGEYRAGDFHNHTTCSDGSTSVRTLTRQSLQRLDWFIQVGHSGAGPRDCRVDDFLYFSRESEFSPGLWINTLEDPESEIKGDFVDSGLGNGSRAQSMWRWQMLQEFSLNQIVSVREEPMNAGKEATLGLEWTVPGHEHTSTAIVTGQYDAEPNADAMAQFEYCFGRPSNDTSQGGGQGWTCEISEESNQQLIDLFAGRDGQGAADYNASLVNGVNTADEGDHVKSTAGVLWMLENFPGDSFAVQAHIERQGGFVRGENRGYNIEHIRDWNGVAPEINLGMESEPGHQAVRGRGGYGSNASGGGTFGGVGCYAGAEAAPAGFDFEGNDLGNERAVVCRPGVRTMWDALLSEGRKYYYYASSDWHSRGSFGPLDYETDNDFWPGEFQQNFTWIEPSDELDPGQQIVEGLRSGNGYTVMGKLIDSLSFSACSRGKCATMGETLSVRPGARVTVTLEVNDPKGTNNSPYTFDNPSLLQIGIQQPLNEPKLVHVDLIAGMVTGIVPDHLPDGSVNPEYFEPLAPETTRIVKSWDEHGAKKKMKWSFRAYDDTYVRARGTNIPAGTPNERDAYGNPLPDSMSNDIACTDPACPPHVEGILDQDVEAWADVSFHANPIWIDVRGVPGLGD